jgi:hypothetical protein
MQWFMRSGVSFRVPQEMEIRHYAAAGTPTSDKQLLFLRIVDARAHL